MMDTIEQLRDWCNNIRRNPSPISDAVPMVQKAADEMERLHAELSSSQTREAQLRGAMLQALNASCSCVTKTPDPQYHKPYCGYRILNEALALPHDDTVLRKEGD